MFFSGVKLGEICQRQCVAISPFSKSKYLHCNLNFFTGHENHTSPIVEELLI